MIEPDEVAKEKQKAFERLFDQVEGFIARNLPFQGNMDARLMLAMVREARRCTAEAVAADQIVRGEGPPP